MFYYVVDTQIVFLMQPEKMVIIVRLENGSSFRFRLWPSTPFENMFRSLYEHCEVPTGAIRFVLDGTRIEPGDTPLSTGMKDGDVIDGLPEMTGD